MAKRMLVIADTESHNVKRFLEHVALPDGYEVTIFPIWGYQGRYADFYHDNGVIIYQDQHTLPIIRRIPRVRMWARIWLNACSLLKSGAFDVVHQHYVSQRDLALGRMVSKKCGARWVASLWGSDILRASPKALRRMARLLDKCDCIQYNTDLLRNKLLPYCAPQTAQRMRMMDHGQTGYSHIDAVLQTWDKRQCKAHFGIDPDTYAVCVGYSASSAQQQLPVLEAMQALPCDVLSRMTIVLQQTYCFDSEEYLQKTRAAAAALPCAGVVVMTEFMSDEECARLRIAADAFILAITTDAFCATLRDYLYAGACVLKADWLPYPQLTALGITFHEFSHFDEVPALLHAAFNGDIRGLTDEQRMLLPAHYSWDAVRDDWLAMYR